MRRLPAETPIQDEVNGVNYRFKKYLGHGGFRTAYLAVELNRSGGEKQNSESCLKIALRADEWHGEVYFANLLRNVGHVLTATLGEDERVTLAGDEVA